MGNYENIRPYAEFAHMVAPYGGPEQYLNDYGDARYECGKIDQREADKAAIFTAIAGTAFVSAVINFGIQKYREIKRKRAQEEAEKAKGAYLKAVSSNKVDAEVGKFSSEQ